MTVISNKRVLIFLAIVLGLLCGCSDDKQGKPAETKHDKAAEIQKVMRQAEKYAKQEKERQQKQTNIEERPLIIGVVGPETGEEARYGLSVMNGVLAAAKRFNAQGGIAGKEIKVLHYNDESNIAYTEKIVSYLIKERAIAIISAPTGSSTFTPVHLVENSKTIFISVGSRRNIERSGRFIFRTAVPDEMATEDLIKYATKDLGYVNYALITSSLDEFSLNLSSMFKKALYKYDGVIKLETDVYDTYTGTLKIDLVIDAIKNSPDTLHGVVFTGGASEGALLAQGLKKVGIMLPIIGGEDLLSADYLEGGEAVEGTLLYSTLSSDKKSSKMAEFLKDYGKAEPDRFAALAYDTFMLVADAIKIADSTNTSKVRDALINRGECEGVTGKTSFSPEGAPIKHPLICKIKSSKNGGQTLVLKQ
jgi:branched-chain amino acid transport system substrate-binding protein